VAIRNKFFDWGILQVSNFDIPVICVGNLVAGGTGKTPHTEFLLSQLQTLCRPAVLSRGYKRRTKGFLLAKTGCTAQSIGDESYQIWTKYPDVVVAVDKDRRRGITRLMGLKPRVDVIVLDDGFQHRYVNAGLNILLTDYRRLFCDDALLPAGRLREPAGQKKRAQIVIVTKCPANIKPIDFNIIGKRLHLRPHQSLFFSTFVYGELTPVFSEGGSAVPLHSIASDEDVLLVTGIAAPDTLEEELKKYTPNVHLLAFGDHHEFTQKDIRLITERWEACKNKKKWLITTEKDAVRLRQSPYLDTNENIRKTLYMLPVKVAILKDNDKVLLKNVCDYVRKNPRNG
jgi:tetraacyldisaccharide 4'-kinase